MVSDEYEGAAAFVVVLGDGNQLLAQHLTQIPEDESVDRVDEVVTEQLEGLVVRKDLAEKFKGRFSVPTYVGEFLIGKYCATSNEDIQDGLEQVRDSSKSSVVRTGDHELFKARARRTELSNHRHRSRKTRHEEG